MYSQTEAPGHKTPVTGRGTQHDILSRLNIREDMYPSFYYSGSSLVKQIICNFQVYSCTCLVHREFSGLVYKDLEQWHVKPFY